MSRKSQGKRHAVCCGVLAVIALGACVEAPPPVVVEKPVIIETPVKEEAKVIFEDEFNERKNEWKQVRGKWEVENGQMLQARDDPRELNALMYVDEFDVSDVEITTRVSLRGGTSSVSGGGLVFRLRDEKNYYMFRLAGSGVVFGKMVNDEWTDLANPRAADFRVDGRVGPTEELRVRISGNRIQCWVGDDSVVNMVDGQFATGRVGLATFKAEAAFDFIKIVELLTAH